MFCYLACVLLLDKTSFHVKKKKNLIKNIFLNVKVRFTNLKNVMERVHEVTAFCTKLNEIEILREHAKMNLVHKKVIYLELFRFYPIRNRVNTL